MDKQLIRDMLASEISSLIDDIQVFDEIDSTNLESLRQIKAGKTGTRLIIADAQTAGRGRRDRPWISPAGSGIYLSLTRTFGNEVNALQCLSLVAALSVLGAAETLGASGLQLKWPNDVLVGRNKLAGILLELQTADSEKYLVIGIGLNLALSTEARALINQPVTDLATVLIKQGGRPDASVVAVEIVNQLIINIIRFEEQGFSPFMKMWNFHDKYLNHVVVIQAGNSRTTGKSLGVDENAALILQTASGRELITGGEIFPSLHELPEDSD
ncbi:MAG: biotin--[acetyl-CoA-carboxylase] ligase [Proteobacteria bacterium]|nr:biotin--[acetyl-CoA-carboxylase] ligase [Pseudomonadota bacterium]